jgi:hypothetical protein
MKEIGLRRKNSRFFRRSSKKKEKGKTIFIFFILVLIVVSIFIIHFFTNEAKDKYTVLLNNKGGDILVVNIDNRRSEYSEIIIPADTEVLLSNGYGKIRAGKVLQLEKNLYGDGLLLKNTIRDNFYYPIEYYFFINSDISNISIILLPKMLIAKNTNMPLDIRLSFISSLYTMNNRQYFNLKDTKVISKDLLADGEEGYRIEGDSPSNILSIFNTDLYHDKKVVIYTRGGIDNSYVVRNMIKIFESMGILPIVTSYEKDEYPKSDNNLCLMDKNGDKRLKAMIQRIYSCSEVNSDDSQNDISIFVQ